MYRWANCPPPGGGGNNEPNYDSWVAQANTKSIKQQEEHRAQIITNTSLNEQKNNLPKQEFNIHLNPNTGVFSIDVQTLNEQDQFQLSVLDVYGKQLLAQQINNAVNHQIDLSAYSKGIYYVNITGTNGFRDVKKADLNLANYNDYKIIINYSLSNFTACIILSAAAIISS